MRWCWMIAMAASTFGGCLPSSTRQSATGPVSTYPPHAAPEHDARALRHDLMLGVHDVSSLLATPEQQAAYCERGIPFRFALLQVETVDHEQLRRHLRRLGDVPASLRALSGESEEVTAAALAGLHVFSMTPFLSDQDLSSYVCQMVALSEHDRPLIYLNFLCLHKGPWNRQLEYWMDGGVCFVQMLFDVTSGRMVRLRVNGSL